MDSNATFALQTKLSKKDTNKSSDEDESPTKPFTTKFTNLETEEIIGHVQNELKLNHEENPEHIKNFMFVRMHNQSKCSINKGKVAEELNREA